MLGVDWLTKNYLLLLQSAHAWLPPLNTVKRISMYDSLNLSFLYNQYIILMVFSLLYFKIGKRESSMVLFSHSK